MRQLEYGNWKLSSEIGKSEFQITKFGNQNFEELFKDGILNKWINEWNNNNNEIIIKQMNVNSGIF